MAITHIVDLPIPPSTNRLWRHGRGRVHTSAEYRAWLLDADKHALMQGFARNRKPIAGPFEAHVSVGPSRTDLDNVGSKALLDWAQSRQLIENDKYCSALAVTRVETIAAPEGVRLTLSERL